jgi:hypothetical protein
MDSKTSLLDRLGYGAVMLLFGGIAGSLVGLAGLIISNPPHFNIVAFAITLGVFFSIGFTLLGRAAEFLAVCLHSLWFMFNLALQNVSYTSEPKAFSPFKCLCLLLIWLGTITYALLRY